MAADGRVVGRAGLISVQIGATYTAEGDVDHRLAGGPDRLEVAVKQVDDVFGIGGRTDGGDGHGLRDLSGGGQHRGSAEHREDRHAGHGRQQQQQQKSYQPQQSIPEYDIDEDEIPF